MANETTITVIGNLTADPEHKQVGGVSKVDFTIASTPRTFSRESNDWVDGETLFLRAQAWRDLADGIAANLGKGSRVIATGFLKQRSYETKEGEKRTVVEFDVQDIGPAIPKFKSNTQRAGQPNPQAVRDTRPAAPYKAPGDVWNQPDPPGAYQAPGGYDPDAPF